MSIEVITTPAQTSGKLTNLVLKSNLKDRIIATQKDNPFLEKIRVDIGTDKGKGFEINSDKSLMFKGRL